MGVQGQTEWSCLQPRSGVQVISLVSQPHSTTLQWRAKNQGGHRGEVLFPPCGAQGSVGNTDSRQSSAHHCGKRNVRPIDYGPGIFSLRPGKDRLSCYPSLTQLSVRGWGRTLHTLTFLASCYDTYFFHH